MGWVKDRQNTQKPKTETKKREQNTPSKAEQLQCAFRFAAIPGLQATASAADPSRIVKSGGGTPWQGQKVFQLVAACGGLWQPVAADGLPLRIEI